jgi:hypothetical protein
MGPFKMGPSFYDHWYLLCRRDMGSGTDIVINDIKGTVSRDFRILVFSSNYPPFAPE